MEVGGQPVVFNARAQMLEARRAVSRCFFQRKGAKRLRPLGTVRQGGLVCFFKPHGARERGGGAIIDRAPKGDDGGCPLGDRGTNYPDTIQIKAGGRGLVELIQRFSRKKAQRSQKEEAPLPVEPCFSRYFGGVDCMRGLTKNLGDPDCFHDRNG